MRVVTIIGIIISILYFIISILYDKISRRVELSKEDILLTLAKGFIVYIAVLATLDLVNLGLSNVPQAVEQNITTYKLNPMEGEMNNNNLILLKISDNKITTIVSKGDNTHILMTSDIKNSKIIYGDMGTVTITDATFKNKIIDTILGKPLNQNEQYYYNIPERTIK